MLVPSDGEVPEGDVWHTGLRESCNVMGLRRSRKEKLRGHQSFKIKIMVPKDGEAPDKMSGTLG